MKVAVVNQTTPPVCMTYVLTHKSIKIDCKLINQASWFVIRHCVRCNQHLIWNPRPSVHVFVSDVVPVTKRYEGFSWNFVQIGAATVILLVMATVIFLPVPATFLWVIWVEFGLQIFTKLFWSFESFVKIVAVQSIVHWGHKWNHAVFRTVFVRLAWNSVSEVPTRNYWAVASFMKMGRSEIRDLRRGEFHENWAQWNSCFT